MSLWYIGDPCYAIDDDRWGEFCKEIFKYDSKKLERDGITFNWHWIDEDGYERVHRAHVYNSGLGGDGQVNVHGYKLGVDAGLLSVLPLEVCHRLTDAEKTEGQHGSSHAIVEARFRPVFDIDTNNFPHITLDINGSIKHDTTDHTECDECGEWAHENNVVHNEHQGTVCCECEEEE